MSQWNKIVFVAWLKSYLICNYKFTHDEIYQYIQKEKTNLKYLYKTGR